MADAMVVRDGTVLKVSGPMTLATVPALQRECSPAASAAGLAVDLAAAEPVDSSALALLLALRRQVEGLGGRFEVRHVPAALKTLAGLYGVDFVVDNAQPPS